jgi:hypothetical protein
MQLPFQAVNATGSRSYCARPVSVSFGKPSVAFGVSVLTEPATSTNTSFLSVENSSVYEPMARNETSPAPRRRAVAGFDVDAADGGFGDIDRHQIDLAQSADAVTLDERTERVIDRDGTRLRWGDGR